MDYQLPTDWHEWTADQRIDWHGQRVAREEPAYEFLEQEGLLSYLDQTVVEDRLEKIREEKHKVEDVLELCECRDFQRLLCSLEFVMIRACKYQRNRAHLLSLQFKRMKFKQYEEEKEQLTDLRHQTEFMLEQAGKFEFQIIELCAEHSVDANPFLQSHLLRS
jgi:hypothetical protein